VAAFEAHGHNARRSLLPGASQDEIVAVEAELGVRHPRACREPYAWSAGSVDHTRSPALMFRDNGFLPLAEVANVRRRVVEAYDDPARSAPNEMPIWRARNPGVFE
jgi:cell wall assembly regulator SMI1